MDCLSQGLLATTGKQLYFMSWISPDSQDEVGARA
jgi:hypothetical protein